MTNAIRFASPVRITTTRDQAALTAALVAHGAFSLKAYEALALMPRIARFLGWAESDLTMVRA